MKHKSKRNRGSIEQRLMRRRSMGDCKVIRVSHKRLARQRSNNQRAAVKEGQQIKEGK
jgi:hypothetical protein